MVNKKQQFLKIALQHNLKYLKIKNNKSKKILTKNYSIYVYNNKIILHSFLKKKLLNV